MSYLTCYGRVNVDLSPLIQRVHSLPSDAWVSRGDPESYKTSAVRQGDKHWASVAKEIDQLLEATFEYFEPGYFNRVVLSKIPAGEKILPHTDDFGDAIRKISTHCHIPLITHPDVKMGFTENRIEHHLKAGYLYTMDETVYHYVNNDSDIDRVHLLFAHFPHSGIKTKEK